MFIGERIALTLWVGGMWTVGYNVAPMLFQSLDDRALAGSLAGNMFTAMSYVGLVAAVILLSGQVVSHGRDTLRQWRAWMLLAMLLIVVIGQFVLQPMMAELRAAGLQEGTASRFGLLHGLASMLFLINSLAGLALVIAGLRPGIVSRSVSSQAVLFTRKRQDR